MRRMVCVLVLMSCMSLAVMPAGASDYTLGIFGNANMDDTIDEDDIAYVEGIIEGTNEETELADADYDGGVDEDDITQIELIISGGEKELTLIDSADRIVTVRKPITRIIPLVDRDAKLIGVLGAEDKVVGVSSNIQDSIEYEIYLPELTELPSVGSWYTPDYEAILSLNPDLVIAYSTKAAEFEENLPDISVIGFGSSTPEITIDQLVKVGYILDKRDEAEHYLEEFHDKYVDLIKARTRGLSEEDRPKVYVESSSGDYKTYTSTSVAQQLLDITGGRHIFSELVSHSSFATIDPEEVMVKNPDIIIKYIPKGDAGYGVDDTSKAEALRVEIMNRPELANVTAVKNGHVYIVSSYLSYGLDYPVLLAYWAKWLHPDLFEDLDPQTIHQEYLTDFFECDYDLNEHGAFVYPLLEEC
ncbi:MAG: ABC transporter substrate-binding protein [Methanotrichaceae archaeon]